MELEASSFVFNNVTTCYMCNINIFVMSLLNWKQVTSWDKFTFAYYVIINIWFIIIKKKSLYTYIYFSDKEISEVTVLNTNDQCNNSKIYSGANKIHWWRQFQVHRANCAIRNIPLTRQKKPDSANMQAAKSLISLLTSDS